MHSLQNDEDNMNRRIYKGLVSGLIILLSVGCAAKQTEDKTNSLNIPAEWTAEHINQENEINKEWWKSFNSSGLEQLIDEGLKKSPDVITAAESIIQADAQITSSRSSIFPSLDLRGGSSWNKNYPNQGDSRISESSSLSLGVSYEVDLWGRISATVRGAKETLKAAEYDYDAVKLTLTSGIATAYFQLLATERQIEIAQTNLNTAENILRIVRSKYNNGSALRSDLLNQESTVLSRQNSLLSLKEQKQQTANALAILIGVTPQEFATVEETFDNLTIPIISAGLPSELLLRRPDLASAEAQLRASDANLDAARAALLPTISLSGSAGLATDTLFSLANPARSIGLSASLVQTIFDGGKKKSAIKISESQKRVVAEKYRKAVLTALKEVEDALNSSFYSREREYIQAETTTKLETSLKLIEARYKEGSDSLTDVLNAQTSLFQARDQLVSLRLSRLSASVDLYKVLGGGWEQ